MGIPQTNSTESQEHAKADATAQFEFMVIDGSMLFALAFLCRIAMTFVRRSVRLEHDPPRREYILMVLDITYWSCLWFAFSVSLVVYNKWLLHSWEGGFDFPLLLTMFHMILKYVLSWIVVRCSSMRDQVPNIPRRVWWLSAVPVGISTALDIAASNGSYIYITVTFYTIVKSSSLLFTLFFSILYGLQPLSIPLTVAVFTIGSGVLLASYGETRFNMIGFGLILGASAVGGFRWALTQVLMRQIRCELNAIITIYMISPSSALTLVPMALWLEGDRFFSSPFVNDSRLLLLSVANVLGSGVFAFLMILVELELLGRTSSMTMGVISYAKQMLQIGFSILIFHDRINIYNILGLIVTIVGMAMYKHIKQKPAERKMHVNIERERDGLFVFDDLAHEFDDDLSSGFYDKSGTNGTQTQDAMPNRDRLHQRLSLRANSSGSMESGTSYQSIDLQ